MKREEFRERMVTFENDLGYHNSFNLAWIFFPWLFIINLIRNKSKRELSRKTYSQLLSDIDKIEPPLDPKEYHGWKKRIHSSFHE